MKIAIPVDDASTKTKISNSFGRAPYFLIYDTETEQFLPLENDAAESPNGAGVKASQLIIKHDVNAVLTPRCGGNAIKILKSAKIDVYKTVKGSVQDNISDFAQDKLSILDQTQVGHHGLRS